MSDKPTFELKVYEDHVIVSGWIDSDILIYLIKAFSKKGFTNVASSEDGFKLVRKVEILTNYKWLWNLSQIKEDKQESNRKEQDIQCD